MESPEVTFTLAYIVFAVCFVFTPDEFRSAGLTVQHIFSSWLGSEDVGFIQYHVRRTSITILAHSALPLGYYMGMCIAAPERNLVYIHQENYGWRAFLLLSFCLQLASWTLIIYWSQLRWSNHPISQALKAHASPAYSCWGTVATSINTEFRRIDKFATGPPGARVIVTDTWVLKVTTYHVYVALQRESHLTVTESRQHQLNPESSSPTQTLTLRVESINPNVRSFDIKLNSTEYAELREKLSAPIRNAANVVIHQTMSDLFLETFKAQVELNQPYILPSGQVVIMIQSAKRVSANPCGVCPVWVDGSPAVRTSKDLRPGWPAGSPAPLVEPSSVYWMSVWFTENQIIIIDSSRYVLCLVIGIISVVKCSSTCSSSSSIFLQGYGHLVQIDNF